MSLSASVCHTRTARSRKCRNHCDEFEICFYSLSHLTCHSLNVPGVLTGRFVFGRGAVLAEKRKTGIADFCKVCLLVLV